jgi:hypothetical protein
MGKRIFPFGAPKMKKVCVSVVGSGQLHEITIQPGTTAGDILRDLNLSDYLLSSSPSADFFPSSESVYEKVADGQKVFASTKATVGSSTLFNLIRTSVEKYLSGSHTPVTPHASALVPAHNVSRVVHSKPIRRLPLPYWQEAGWSKAGNVYRGNYQTRYGAYQGWIEERSPHNIRFYILDPPDEVIDSSHGPCFQSVNGNWFHVHMSTRPQDISSGIAGIERLITDCSRRS